eukprot:COSAG01_NODE_439_length_17034_cov_5.326484_4_plen_235_part_00
MAPAPAVMRPTTQRSQKVPCFGFGPIAGRFGVASPCSRKARFAASAWSALSSPRPSTTASPVSGEEAATAGDSGSKIAPTTPTGAAGGAPCSSAVATSPSSRTVPSTMAAPASGLAAMVPRPDRPLTLMRGLCTATALGLGGSWQGCVTVPQRRRGGLPSLRAYDQAYRALMFWPLRTACRQAQAHARTQRNASCVVLPVVSVISSGAVHMHDVLRAQAYCRYSCNIFPEPHES